MFTPEGRGTRLDQHAVMRPKRWGWLLLPLLPLVVRRNTRDCGISLRRAAGSWADAPAGSAKDGAA